ncbi:MAG: hypothetical protein HN368_13630 [Spirochaetales bacterium]|jgi:hypothetical protein|nr:hypothetical protein [Spirochaetales bacterium]
MPRLKKFFFLVIFAAIVIPGIVFAQEEAPDMGFGFDLGIGAESFNEIGVAEPVTYQTLSLNPDFAISKFGIGLDITIHYRFTGGDGTEFEIRKADWVPDANNSFFELYLPLFRYIRWGFRGEPLYIKLGSIDDATLGNGFIMGNYANTLFLPEERIFGLNFDMDGQLFKFPFVGFQSFIGNLAHPDVIGGRLFGRPLLWLDVPVISALEVGYTVAGDIDPFYYTETPDWDGDSVSNEDEEPVVVHGADFRLPIISNKIISLAAFGDLVFQNANTGGMIGVGGALFNFLPFGAQLRFLGENFIPAYFSATYDIYRPIYQAIATSTETVIPGTTGWFASTGFAFFEGLLAMSINIDGPFKKPLPDEPDNWVNWPHLRGTLLVGEGLLPGFDFNAWYDKKNISTFGDLFDPVDAVIGAAINYQTGPAVITLEYDVRYNPEYDAADPLSKQWDTSAKLKSSISLF